MAPQLIFADHYVLTVENIENSVSWYERVLGMRRHEWQDAGGTVRVSLHWREGAGRWRKINLHQAGTEFAPHAKSPTAGSADLCFIIDYSVNRMQEHLKECWVAVELGPVNRTGAMGGIASLYVRDPDGNLIELSEDLMSRHGHVAEWESQHPRE